MRTVLMLTGYPPGVYREGAPWGYVPTVASIAEERKEP